MTQRKLKNLELAEALPSRPSFIPLPRRARGTRAMGLAYEKKVFRALSKALPGSKVTHGQWFRYQDERGLGYCQTDILIEHGVHCVVVECKLTDVEEATEKLYGLYIPITRAALHYPDTIGVVVTKHLTNVSDLSAVVDSIASAIALHHAGTRPILHWLGHGPI